MNCPHCGMKVRDPDLSSYCPACGKELPVRTRDERNDITFQRLSGTFAILSMFLLIMGFSLLLPEIIMYYIMGPGETLYWPIQIYLIVAGIALLVVRHPFAKRRAVAKVQLIRNMDKMWVCSYCGKNNIPGSLECESCGAPLR
jgi:uncharacterized paraquat-inducible protein A